SLPRARAPWRTDVPDCGRAYARLEWDGASGGFAGAAARRAARLYYRARRHLDVQPGDESRRSGLSAQAIWRRPVAGMRGASIEPVERAAAAECGKERSPAPA